MQTKLYRQLSTVIPNIIIINTIIIVAIIIITSFHMAIIIATLLLSLSLFINPFKDSLEHYSYFYYPYFNSSDLFILLLF